MDFLARTYDSVVLVLVFSFLFMMIERASDATLWHLLIMGLEVLVCTYLRIFAQCMCILQLAFRSAWNGWGEDSRLDGTEHSMAWHGSRRKSDARRPIDEK